MRVRRIMAPLAVSLLIVAGIAGTAGATQTATEDGVVPSLITGTSNNASLCSVVYPGTTELKFDSSEAPGQKTDGTLTVTVTRPSALLPLNNNSIDWEVDDGPNVIGVIVKDGVDGANNYDYSPGDTGDRRLTTPNDGAKGISNIKFCYGTDETPDAAPLVIDKDAKGTYDNTFTWDIQKTVSPTGPIFTNANTVTLSYEVVVTRDDGTISNVEVAGSIKVTNPNGAAVAINGVTDELSDGTPCTVTGGGPQDLPSGPSSFDYSCDLGDALPAGSVDNEATVTWDEQTLSNDAFLAAGSDVVAVPVTFTGKDIDECVDVSDSVAGVLGTTCDDAKFNYTRDITVQPGCNEYENTATFETNDTETTGSSSTTVEICQVNKNGFTMGYWQNKNGQADLFSFGTAGCVALKTMYPNVLGGLNCSTVANFQKSVKDIIKAAESSTDGVKMFKAQFLATALSVKKTPALGATNVSVDGSLLGTGDCISVDALLVAANVSFPSLSTNKANLLTVKDYFDDINNNQKVTCAP